MGVISSIIELLPLEQFSKTAFLQSVEDGGFRRGTGDVILSILVKGAITRSVDSDGERWYNWNQRWNRDQLEQVYRACKTRKLSFPVAPERQAVVEAAVSAVVEAASPGSDGSDTFQKHLAGLVETVSEMNFEREKLTKDQQAFAEECAAERGRLQTERSMLEEEKRVVEGRKREVAAADQLLLYVGEVRHNIDAVSVTLSKIGAIIDEIIPCQTDQGRLQDEVRKLAAKITTHESGEQDEDPRDFEQMVDELCSEEPEGIGEQSLEKEVEADASPFRGDVSAS